MTTVDTADAIARSATAVTALAEWAAAVRFDDLPAVVRRRAAIVLADDLGAMVAARDEPEVRAAQDRLIARGGTAEATVFAGGRRRTGRYAAATANGLAADWCELDEGYRHIACHAGLYVIPALVADAESDGRTTADVLRALAVGYEVTARFAAGFPLAFGTFHPHAQFAALGAAAGVAALRGFDAGLFRDAITAAATMIAPGPFNHVRLGALVRNVWPAQGAWTGLNVADWAEAGIGGVAVSPYHVFVDGLHTGSDPDAMTRGLGAVWAITEGYHKIYACCQYAHAAVEASLDIMARLPTGRGSADLDRIVVETHERARLLTNTAPPTSLGAMFSMPHAMAAVAVVGHAGPAAFSASTLTDPEIDALRRRVELVPYEPAPPPPNDRPARVTWQFRDGERVTAECLSARGGPDRPFGVDEILAKVESLAGPVYPEMAPVAARLIALEPGLLDEPWGSLIERFAGR